jgi:hypothetical protein
MYPLRKSHFLCTVYIVTNIYIPTFMNFDLVMNPSVQNMYLPLIISVYSLSHDQRTPDYFLGVDRYWRECKDLQLWAGIGLFYNLLQFLTFVLFITYILYKVSRSWTYFFLLKTTEIWVITIVVVLDQSTVIFQKGWGRGLLQFLWY